MLAQEPARAYKDIDIDIDIDINKLEKWNNNSCVCGARPWRVGLRIGASNPTLVETVFLMGIGGGTLRDIYKFRGFPEGTLTS